MKVNIEKYYGYSASDKKIVAKAIKLIEDWLNSESFKTQVLKAKLTETNGLTNQQVYEKILAGGEDYRPDLNQTMDISLSMYSKWWSKVVGWVIGGKQGDGVIHTNRKFFGDEELVASNIIHEYAHLVGFYHDGVWATSVPYRMNQLFADRPKK